MENKQGELGRSWYHPDYCYLTYVYNRETPEPLQDSRQIPHGNPQMMAPPPVQSYPMMPPVYPPPGQPRFPAPYQPHQPTTRFGFQPQFTFQNPVQQWTSPIPPRQWYVCGFCLNAGHVLRDKFGVRCPLLRRIVCPNCGATGDNAHTLKFCPWTRNNVGGNEGSNNNGDPGVSADEASRFNTK